MTDQAADARLHDYRPTVPKAYIALAWLWVAVPFGYGFFELILKVKQLLATRRRHFLTLCCGPCSFLYSALSMRSRKNALSISLMPLFATAGMPANLWK